jgi:hypothetical protein
MEDGLAVEVRRLLRSVGRGIRMGEESRRAMLNPRDMYPLRLFEEHRSIPDIVRFVDLELVYNSR